MNHTTPPCLAALPKVPPSLPIVEPVAIVRYIHTSPHPTPTAAPLCWIRRAGRAYVLRQHEQSYIDSINAGLLTAGEPFRVDPLERYLWPEQSPFHGYTTTFDPDPLVEGRWSVLNWACFRATDGDDKWAIRSARAGSLCYGSCEGCVGLWNLDDTPKAPPILPRMTGR